MKTFIADIIPRIQRFSQKLDNLTMLQNQHWVLIENIDEEKQVYIFRPDNRLLISKNGAVEIGRWEDLGNKSLLIEQGGQAYLFKHGFFDGILLALKKDSKEEYALFVNENRFAGDLNSSDRVLQFLKGNYLRTNDDQEIQKQRFPPQKQIEENRIPKDKKKKLQSEIDAEDSATGFIAFIIIVAVISLIVFIVNQF